MARVNEAQTVTQLIARCDIGTATATVYSVAIWSNAWSTATKLADITVSPTPAVVNLSSALISGGGLALAFTNGYTAVTNGTVDIRSLAQ